MERSKARNKYTFQVTARFSYHGKGGARAKFRRQIAGSVTGAPRLSLPGYAGPRAGCRAGPGA
ncbi:hypothetical protein GCM10017673_28320 [Streptosporangium violaceochromogenes]|nr:hypothetical protein GCM10017673_28320 [Streptosporangium violaceochromogenes]